MADEEVVLSKKRSRDQEENDDELAVNIQRSEEVPKKRQKSVDETIVEPEPEEVEIVEEVIIEDTQQTDEVEENKLENQDNGRKEDEVDENQNDEEDELDELDEDELDEQEGELGREYEEVEGDELNEQDEDNKDNELNEKVPGEELSETVDDEEEITKENEVVIEELKEDSIKENVKITGEEPTKHQNETESNIDPKQPTKEDKSTVGISTEEQKTAEVTNTDDSTTEVPSADTTEQDLLASSNSNGIPSAIPVFGSGTIFGSKPSSSSSSAASAPKVNVFGSGTTFGSSTTFGSGTNFGSGAFGSSEKKTSVFGSGTTFGSGSVGGSDASESLITSKSTSIFDQPDVEHRNNNDGGSDGEEAGNGGNDSRDESQDQLFVKVPIPLEQIPIETGEESEDPLFSCRARLYALDLTAPSDGWKERGVGTLHVNKERDNKKSRLVMRTDGVFRVILNLPLLKSTEIFPGMKSSMASEKFVRITGFETDKPHQFAIKASNKDLANTLLIKIQGLISEQQD